VGYCTLVIAYAKIREDARTNLHDCPAALAAARRMAAAPKIFNGTSIDSVVI
jgi:hypothetical protein